MGPMITDMSGPPRKEKEDTYRLYDYFGWKPKQVGNALYVIPNQTCSKLEGLKCGVHKTKPEGCRRFPADRDDPWYKIAKKEGCTYRFVKVKRRGR